MTTTRFHRHIRPESSRTTLRAGIARQNKLHRAIAEVLEPRRLCSTVTVNSGSVLQTIKGLGGDYALGAIEGPYNGGVAQDAVGDLTLQYLSPTEARVGLPLAEWAPTNDNGQGSPTWSGYQDTGLVHNVFTLLQQLSAKGIQITLTTWDMPNWMCSNPSASQQREIATGMDQAYATAVASFVARAQSVYGVNISYFSVNEADEGNNILLTSQQEAALIKVVGAQFQTYGLATKWLVGDTAVVTDAVSYISGVLQDPTVLPYVGGISYHTWYSAGVPASSFSAIASLGQQYGLPVFADEVGSPEPSPPASSTWEFAAQVAQSYYNVLGPGEVNAAMYWEYENDIPVASTSGQLYPIFYVLQQIENTFTPGTQVVSSSSNDSTLLPLAVVNPTTGAFTVQVQSTNSIAEQVTLTGLTTGTYTAIRTSATEEESDDGTYTVGANGTLTITLPADSFTTLTTAKPWAVGTPGQAAISAQLTGTASANTTGSYANSGDTYANVFDGNTNTFFDSPTASGNWVQLNFGSPQTITSIAYAPRPGFEARMVGGLFEASNDPTFSTGVTVLYTVASTPSDGITTQEVNASGTYQYVRYVAPAGSYGNIAEMQVFGFGNTGSSGTGNSGTGTGSSGSGTTGGTTGYLQLTGTASANTTGSYDNLGDTYANAFDGNIYTFFDAPTANGNWIQLNFGSPASITAIAFAPRNGFETRMEGGIFEASDDPTFTTGVVTLYTVPASAPTDPLNVEAVSVNGTYQYVRYVSPANSYGDIAEMQVFGNPPAITGAPQITAATTTQNTQTTSGLVLTDASSGALYYLITGITNGNLYQSDGVTPISNGQYITLAQGAAGLKFTPSQNLSTTSGSTFSFSAQASATASSTGLGGSVATATITVNPLLASGTPSITPGTTSENTQTSSGLVITTADPNTLYYLINGITNGTLYQSNGTTAITNGQYITLAQGAAGLLFTPTANLSTAAGYTFSFSAQPSSIPSSVGLGGSAATASITVTPVAHCPTITPATTIEGTQSTIGLVITANALDTWDTNLAYQITGITNGTLTLSDGVTPVVVGQFITAAQGAAGLDFTPAAGLTSPGSTFGFSVQASIDGTVAGLAGATVPATITVNPPPASGTPNITKATTSENTQSTSGLVITAADPSTLYYLITGIANGTLFLNDGVTPIINGQYITLAQGAAGLLFTPASNLSTAAGSTFSFSAQPSSTPSSVGLGGSAATASITVNPVAHSPTITPATTIEGTQSTSGLVITANALDTWDTNLAYQITAITSGTLTLSDGVTPVVDGQFITAAQGAAGLDFTPAAGLTSPGSTFGFSVQASIDGTVAGLAGATVPATITVNPPPASGTPSITTATTSENTQSTSGLVITTTDPNTLYYLITGITNGTLFLNDGVTPIINGQYITLAQGAAGLLFTPTANLSTAAGSTFSFSAQPSSTPSSVGLGGTAATASITVTPVAHCPTITPATTIEGTQSSNGLVITPNALDTNDASLAYQITGITNGTLYLSNGITAVSNGTFITAAQGAAGLKFTPSAGLTSPGSAFGFSVQASADGTIGGLGGSIVPGTITVTNPTPVRLTGTASASTTGSYDGKTSDNYTAVFDGNTNTFFDSPTASGNWVQLNLGAADTISSIAYAPRPGFEYRMVGGIFQASNDPTFSNGVVTLYTVTSTPNDGLTTVAVSPGGTYQYIRYVAPANAYGNIAEMQIVGITGSTTGSPAPTAPAAPGAPTLVTSTSATATIAWTASATAGVTGYIVFRNGSQIGTTSSSVFTYSDSGLSPSTTYSYTVEAIASGVDSLPSGALPVITPAAPVSTTPAQLTGTASASTTGSYDGKTSDNYTAVFDGNTNTYWDVPSASGNYVQLNLGAADTITSMAYAPRPGFEYRMVGGVFEVSNDPTFSTGVVTLYSVTSTPNDGLTTVAVSPGGTYQYIRYVAPAGSYGNIAEMQVFGTTGGTSGSTSGAAAPAPPGAPTLTSSTSTTATIAWTASATAGVTGYTVFRNGSQIGTTSSSVFTYSDSGLSPSTTYSYTVEAVASGVDSLPSGALPVITPAAPVSTTPAQLTGIASASTTGSYDGKTSDNYTAVFDGNTNTYWDAPSGSGNYVQLNLSAAHKITEISYAPRTGFEYRMVGGIFEASNDPTFSTGVVTLYTVTSTPNDGLTTVPIGVTGTYQYIRYVAPANSYGNIAEMQIFGT